MSPGSGALVGRDETPRRQGAVTDRKTPPGPDGTASGRDRLLPWIAAERTLRALLLITLGIVLVSHVHTDWGHTVTSFAQRLGLNPNDNGIRRLTAKLHAASPKETAAFGVIAIAYGVLEAVEAYGLFRRRRWGEILTVVATALLFIPEIWELVTRPSGFKVGALVVNAAIVAYLLYRLRAKSR
jgi:uncharacterized membrane protein (DUF2068 family)